MKKTVLYLVIFAFSFLLIPNSFWHDCNELHPTHRHDTPGETHFEKGDCFVCDFQLFPLEIQNFCNFKFSKVKHFEFNANFIEIDLISLDLISLRGPPQV